MLGEPLGEGGMAVVYRAIDETLRREVAIKVLAPARGRSIDLIARFQREARATAALSHPAILKLFDVGDDPPHLVMELIHGENLSAWQQREGALLGEAVALVGGELAGALAAAHAAGVIHRDVKPANVMVTRDGRLVLCDFGVAHLVDDDALATQSGMVLGTPAFMSPEQAHGKKVDARTDVYALGATLYALATGRPPYKGTTAAVLAQISRGELERPSRHNPALGPALEREILRAMAADPAERHPDMASFGAALAESARVPGLPPLPALLTDPRAWHVTARPLAIDAAVARAEAALRRREVARALAECDRVLALEPDEPRARAIVDRVARKSRLRGLALGGAVLLALGGGTVLVLRAMRHTPVVVTVSDAAPPADAPPALPDAGVIVIDAAIPEAPPAVVPDASPARVRHPMATVRDAGPLPTAVHPDAAPVVVPQELPLTIDIRPYCELSIDGVAHGRSPLPRPILLPPGKHHVRCVQPATGLVHEEDVDLDRPLTIKATLVPRTRVTVATRAPEVLVDGVRHASGSSFEISVGRHRVEIPGTPAAYLDFPMLACRLREAPELACEAPAP